MIYIPLTLYLASLCIVLDKDSFYKIMIIAIYNLNIKDYIIFILLCLRGIFYTIRNSI
jgi:hypothetical protein